MPRVAVEHLRVGDVLDLADDLGLLRVTVLNSEPRLGRADHWFLRLNRAVLISALPPGSVSTSPYSRDRETRQIEAQLGTLFPVNRMVRREVARA